MKKIIMVICVLALSLAVTGCCNQGKGCGAKGKCSQVQSCSEKSCAGKCTKQECPKSGEKCCKAEGQSCCKDKK